MHDNVLAILDAGNGRERAVMSGHYSWIRDCTISPDGTFAADGERAMLALPASLVCLAIHPWQPFVMCGDAIGNVYQAAVAGMEYGLVFATAIAPEPRSRCVARFVESRFP